MRVAHFSTEYPPCITGGLGRHVEELIRELKYRAEIDLYLPFEDPSLNCQESFTVFQTPIPYRSVKLLTEYPSKHVFRMGFYMALHCLKTKRNYDVIHCHDWLTGVAGILLKRLLQSKLIVTCHLPQFRPSESILEQMILEDSDTIISVSDHIRNLLVDRYKLPSEKITTIRNGVDAKFFTDSSEKRRVNSILFVGRIVPQKGLDILIYSLKYLILKMPDIKLYVVGDGDWMQDAKNLARDCGYPDRIEFCGWKSKEELLEYYQKCSLFVMPSQFEPFGLTALEAMACGLPIVASRVGGLKEIVIDKWNGFLVDMKSPQSFAGRIFQVLVNPELWKKFSYNSRTLAVESSWEFVADHVLSVYSATNRRDCDNNPSRSLGCLYRELWRSYRQNCLTGEVQ